MSSDPVPGSLAHASEDPRHELQTRVTVDRLGPERRPLRRTGLVERPPGRTLPACHRVLVGRRR